MGSIEKASRRIELMSVKGRLKTLGRKRLAIYLSVSALIVIAVSFFLANVFLPPTIPDFELQVTDWDYNPSIGSFWVSGTIGIPVPAKYYYNVHLVSITDGNKTITSFSNLGRTSVTFHLSFGKTDRAGPDWAFLIGEGITLESKVVQLTLGYAISHGGPYASPRVLERGTKVFSVNVA